MDEDNPQKQKGLYYCRHCHKMLSTKHMYVTHLTGHNLTDKEIQLEFLEPCKVRIRNEVPKIKRKKGLQKNKSERSKGPPLKCEKCDRSYTSMHHLNAHMKLKHNFSIMAELPRRKKSVECEEDNCGTICDDMEELRGHMEVVHPLVLYECSRCRYKGKIKHMFHRHIARVHEKQSDKICEFCGKSFLKSHHMRVHKVRHHDVDDPTLKIFRCDAPGCSYQTFALNILQSHKHKHKKGKPFSCKLCSKKLKTEKNLQKHMKKIHERIRPFICEICGVDYGEESELKLHMVRHDEAKHFCCTSCSYTTYSKSILESHLYVKHKIKTGRYKVMLKCPECEFETPNPGKLEEHTNAHKNIRPHQCDMCDKAFFTKPTLKEHKKWVHNKATLKCPYCVFTAPVKSHLKKHIRVLHTHRDLKPYKCYYCDYRCNVSGNCRKHIVQKHKGLEIKWVKICDPPVPSLTPDFGSVAPAITNTGDTYVPKRGRKRRSGPALSEEGFSSKSRIRGNIAAEPRSSSHDYGDPGSESKALYLNQPGEAPPHQDSHPYTKDTPSEIIYNHQQHQEAATSLAKLSTVETIEDLSQGYGHWDPRSARLPPPQPINSVSMHSSGASGSAGTTVATSSSPSTYMDLTNSNPYLETLTQATLQSYMAQTFSSMVHHQQQQHQQQQHHHPHQNINLAHGRPVLPTFNSMLPSSSQQHMDRGQHHMQVHDGRNTGASLHSDRHRNSNMPDVVPSESNGMLKDNNNI